MLLRTRRPADAGSRMTSVALYIKVRMPLLIAEPVSICAPQEALEMEKKAAALHKELYLPIDQVAAQELEPGAQTKIVWTMDFGSGKV